METLLVWLLRLMLLLLGAGAAVWIAHWVRDALRERRETWAVRTGLGMLLLAAIYAAGHARLLIQRTTLEEGRARYARYGDPRLAEIRRAEVRGWILDCTGDGDRALARYDSADGEIVRSYPLGQGGANLVGGGEGAGLRDYTIERLYASRLREPRDWRERGQLHPAGSNLRLTLCRGATGQAWQLLRGAGRPGAVVVQDVATGAVVAYAATGGPGDPPLGIRRYAPPGSVIKLALAALWWENGLPDTQMGCPSTIEVTPRATISNAGRFSIPSVEVPHGMLVPSCNTTAVAMALQMREQLGAEAFIEGYRRFGFTPYDDPAPQGVEPEFWATSSSAWQRRMSPPPSRLRISDATGAAEWAQLAIGQGPIDVTVVGISRFVQAIGNNGIMLRPTLEWEQAESPSEVERVMSAETARRLQVAMRDVVERGTARSVAPRLRGIPWRLGGKTGTAQIPGAPDDGWFAGLIFGPDEAPRYSVVVYLQGGGPGGARPASIAAELTRFLASDAEVGGQVAARGSGR
ncbi:MAG: hypothetical protein H0X65_03710 [Gemmatimonadetes bacterium]|nr:hypothetical protein [Gemmatimonadota bacterium]